MAGEARTPGAGGEGRPAVTRRRVVATGAAWAVGAAWLLAACGPQGPEAGQSPSGGATPGQPAGQAGGQDRAQGGARQPQRGGTYRILGAGEIRSLDPGGAEGSEDWWSAGLLLYNMLYFYDKDGKFYADLAADMPRVSADGTVYTIPLRKGVKFHNGREMVAEDVAFSMAWQLWPEVYSWGKTYMDSVVGYEDVIAGKTKELAGVKVVDPYTVQITLKKPQAVFPAILTMSMNAIIPKKEVIEAGKDFGTKVVIGTGPFKFVEWVRGQRAVYERHADYFKPGLPYLDRIELSLNVEPAVQMLKWESNEAEHVVTIPQGDLPGVLSDAKFQKVVKKTPSSGTTRLSFQFKGKPFDDLKVRQAVAMAIDKETFAKRSGGSTAPTEGIYTPMMAQYDKAFKSKYRYDPRQAKALLAGAGYGSGIKGVKIFGGRTSKPQLELYQADLKEIGIESEVITGLGSEWRDRIRAGEIHLNQGSWAASFPDAFDFVSAWMSCASIETGFNDGNYCNRRIDDLMDGAERLPLLDPKRIAAYREIEDLVVNQDAAMIGVGYGVAVRLGKEYVHDDFPDGIYGGWPFLETAWMEKR